MNNGSDDFSDIINRSDRGIYGGSLGGDEYEGLVEQLTPGGDQITMSCRKCGKRHNVTVEWQELYVIGRNQAGLPPVLPQGWAYSQQNGAVYPVSVKCGGCGEPLCPQITPDEARRLFNQGLHAGYVTEAQSMPWKHSVDQYFGRQG